MKYYFKKAQPNSEKKDEFGTYVDCIVLQDANVICSGYLLTYLISGPERT